MKNAAVPVVVFSLLVLTSAYQQGYLPRVVDALMAFVSHGALRPAHALSEGGGTTIDRKFAPIPSPSPNPSAVNAGTPRAPSVPAKDEAKSSSKITRLITIARDIPLFVDRHGTIILNGKSIDRDGIIAVLDFLTGNHKGALITISSPSSVQFGVVAKVINVLKAGGYTNVSLAKSDVDEKQAKFVPLDAKAAAIPEKQLEIWFQKRFQSCWTQPIKLPSGPPYTPEIRVQLNLDGSLAGSPTLLNPPFDQAWKPLVDSAFRAIRLCNPLPIPPAFKPSYNKWKDKVVRFDDNSQPVSKPVKAMPSDDRKTTMAYVRRLRDRIGKHRFWPRHGHSGTTLIAFRLDKDGNLISESVAKSSGSAKLDAAAMEIVRRALPYKPPPGAEHLEFRVPINFSDNIRVTHKR